jgi:hypothetical protein
MADYPGFSGMEVVYSDGTLNFPGKCVLSGDAEGPFLDTNTWLNAKDIGGIDPYGYISVAKVRDMGRAIGMVPREDVERLQGRIDDYGAKIDALTKQVDALTAIKELEKELVDA